MWITRMVLFEHCNISIVAALDSRILDRELKLEKRVSLWFGYDLWFRLFGSTSGWSKCFRLWPRMVKFRGKSKLQEHQPHISFDVCFVFVTSRTSHEITKYNILYICLSAQSIVHLTAHIQNMETCIANFFGGAEDLILVQLTLLIQKIT